MIPSRTVWVVADSAGRQLARISISKRMLEFAGLLVGLAFVGMLGAAVHGLSLRARQSRASELGAQVARLRNRVAGLQRALPSLDGLLQSNDAALTQLERKSGFTFVSLAASRAAAAGEALLAAEVNPDDTRARGLRLEAWLGDLLEYWHDAERRLANTPSVRPARTAWLSSSFGVRVDPISHYTVMHKGLDLAGYMGMLVYAPADGRVIWTGLRGGYGQVVVLDHGWGLQTHYAHLSKYLVERGDRVQRGDPLAEMGNTGKSTGPHLHYEVRQDGLPIDPRNFILD